MTENYDYIAKLERDNSGYYNLFITTYNGGFVSLSIFKCDRRHNMRMDLVSNDLYGTTKYVGTLCQLNDIMNPFSISEGDMLLWCSADQAESLMLVISELKYSTVEDIMSNAKRELINSAKKAKQDPNRRNYLENKKINENLPPTVLVTNVPQIVVNEDKIKIAPGLYQSTKNIDALLGTANDFNNLDKLQDFLVFDSVGANDTDGNTINSDINSGNTIKTNEPDYERILVRKYVRKIN